MDELRATRGVHREPCQAHYNLSAEVAGMKANVANLTGWQETQNDKLGKLEARLNSLAERIEGIFRQILLAVVLALASALVAAGGTIAMLLSKGP